MATRLYPAYTTLKHVRAELPPMYRAEDLPDETVQAHIDSVANLIDGALSRYYRMPAKPLPSGLDGDVDAEGRPNLHVPGQLELLNRTMALRECLITLHYVRGNEQGAGETDQKDSDGLLEQIKKGDVILTYPFLHPDERPYFLPLAEGSPLYGEHPTSARARVISNYNPRTFTRDTTRGWG